MSPITQDSLLDLHASVKRGIPSLLHLVAECLLTFQFTLLTGLLNRSRGPSPPSRPGPDFQFPLKSFNSLSLLVTLSPCLRCYLLLCNPLSQVALVQGKHCKKTKKKKKRGISYFSVMQKYFFYKYH